MQWQGALFYVRIDSGVSNNKNKQKVIEPTLPEIKDDIPDIILSESLPTIEAHLDPELEKTRIELNETIMADPAEAARILTSFIRN